MIKNKHYGTFKTIYKLNTVEQNERDMGLNELRDPILTLGTLPEYDT